MTEGLAADSLAARVVRLATTLEDKRQTREALLRLLTRETDGSVAAGIAKEMAKLDPTAEDEREIRAAKLLTRETDGLAADKLTNDMAELGLTSPPAGRTQPPLNPVRNR